MKAQILKAVNTMGLAVERVKVGSGHQYVSKLDGSKLAGVTSISSMAGFKEAQQWMPAWASKEAVKFLGYSENIVDQDKSSKLTEMLTKIKGMTDNQYFDLLHQAKSAYSRKSKDATDTGSLWHNYLDNYIIAKIKGIEAPVYPSGNEFIIRSVNQFFKWVDEKITEWVISEALVADIDNQYAGTIDAIAIMKDGPAIIDFKFADNKSITWKLQTAGYAKPFSAYGIDIKKRYVIRFPKSEYLKVWDPKNGKYKLIKNELEILEYPEDELAFDFETFMHYRWAEKWVNKSIKNK